MQQKTAGCIVYVIRENDTLCDILRRFDISIRELMELNSCDLLSLKKGQTLIIKKTYVESYGRYMLDENEDLFTVAKKFGVSVPSILKANSNLMPNEIRQGVSIALP